MAAYTHLLKNAFVGCYTFMNQEFEIFKDEYNNDLTLLLIRNGNAIIYDHWYILIGIHESQIKQFHYVVIKLILIMHAKSCL